MTGALEHFHFLRPWWLLLTVPLLWAICAMWFHTRRFNSWQAVVDRLLLDYQLGTTAHARNRLQCLLLALGGCLFVAALSGPSWEEESVPVFRDQRARVIVLDASPSMRVSDVAPDRMTRARFKARDLLEKSRNIQVGMVAFGAAPYVISPLTDDTRTINAMVPSISPDIMPVQGSDLSAALNEAASLMRGAGVRTGQIVLMSDATPTQGDLATARSLRTEGYTVSVLSIGTPEGAPIPAGENYLKDADGNIIIASIDTPAMRQLAISGGGRYSPLSSGEDDLRTLTAPEEQLLSNQARVAEDQQATRWIERGPWLLLPLIPMVAYLFRRGAI
ncbi:MAG: VWA domain-containing protein [Pseudomonadota bacterium]